MNNFIFILTMVLGIVSVFLPIYFITIFLFYCIEIYADSYAAFKGAIG